MAEQQSRRGDQVTNASFTGAFENHLIRLGQKGLNLKDAIDVVPADQLVRMTNVDHDANGDVTARPGQTSLATGGTRHSAVRQLRDPQSSTSTRIWGIDTNLYAGASGGLTLIDTGYSGDPLTLVPHRPPQSGAPWMFVADRNKMRKVRSDGLDLPIGLPAPAAAPTLALDIEHRTSICQFESGDGSQAANWTGAAGQDEDGNPTGVPIAEDDCATAPVPGCAVRFRTTIGNAAGTYDSWWGLALTRDLTQLSPVSGGGGTVPASDDDLIHFWLMFSLPHLLQELRIYFVVSPTFDPTILPGTSGAANTDAYVKGFRRNDFVNFIKGREAQIDAAETSRIHALRDRDLEDRAITDIRESWEVLRAERDPARRLALEAATGSFEWIEFGNIGLPVRRGDFQRIGQASGRDWSTVTGIIIYVRTDTDDADLVVVAGLDDLYLTGGFGPDTVEPGAQQYDYRVTNFDPRTGAESNGSDEMAAGNFLDSLRRAIVVDPPSHSDSAMRQRVYRRGGSLIDDWYFCGVNSANGGTLQDTLADDAIAAAGTLPIDHFQPVPTVDANGDTVLAQPLPALWGPLEGLLFGCGDPYRPGHLYWCLPDAPDHWSASGNREVCPPSEELMHGGVMGHQGFVFSRERLYAIYPHLNGDGSVTVIPTLCKRGIKSRWAYCVGPGGIYFVVEQDGIFVTTGGPEEWISRDIDPIFQGKTVHGLAPIDWTAKQAIRLTPWENKIYFLYQDIDGTRQVLVWSILQKFWRHYTFGRAPALVQGEDETTLLIGSLNLGTTYTHEGTADHGLAIACTLRTGAQSGGVREEKLFGDEILDADRQGVSLEVQNFLNDETIANGTTTLNSGSGRARYILDAFGESPQKGRSISAEIRWSSALARPVLYQLGYAITLQPDITNKRVTNWDDLGHPDEKHVTGITLDVDTGNVARTIVFERDWNGQRTIMAERTVLTAGRHKVAFSWPGVPANQVRIRPDDACKYWMLYRADWIFQPEPPRIAGWDVHFENAWDQYYTGLDLFCDTNGVEKRIEVSVDEQLLSDPFTGLPYFSVTAAGRRVVHLTFAAGRGHVFRFVAIDDNPGLLYDHRWQLDPEPSEQANWNQNFSRYGTMADKWLKAIIFECDTFGQTKNVRVEVDGALVETIPVNTDGRKVQQIALSVQQLGRVWRMYPADGNPGRLYSAQPVFDEEPFCLDRWETQETNHGIAGWFFPTYGHVTLKASADVTLTITQQTSQGEAPITVTKTYTIKATGGEKIRRYVSFQAVKGVLIKYVLTSAQPFWLYQEETVLFVQGWGQAEPNRVQPFGNSDLDPTRAMVRAETAALRSGGAA